MKAQNKEFKKFIKELDKRMEPLNEDQEREDFIISQDFKNFLWAEHDREVENQFDETTEYTIIDGGNK